MDIVERVHYGSDFMLDIVHHLSRKYVVNIENI